MTIRGLPARVRTLRAVRTSEAQQYKELAPVKASAGSVTFEMPPTALLTLVAN